MKPNVDFIVTRRIIRHMNAPLKTFILSFPREQRVAVRRRIATECGLSESMVRHMVGGLRGISAEHVAGIVRASEGRLTHAQLRPDLWSDTALPVVIQKSPK